ncbi:hypothetical protein [uncultured Marivita sp.]|uniref:hypothetical protein n=1 Tax=uncultured Marivita sp. TaxID=888080 RepID=UPI00263619AC|nr:hypothetical protein [uncultured Marivita sp.]
MPVSNSIWPCMRVSECNCLDLDQIAAPEFTKSQGFRSRTQGSAVFSGGAAHDVILAESAFGGCLTLAKGKKQA